VRSLLEHSVIPRFPQNNSRHVVRSSAPPSRLEDASRQVREAAERGAGDEPLEPVEAQRSRTTIGQQAARRRPPRQRSMDREGLGLPLANRNLEAPSVRIPQLTIPPPQNERVSGLLPFSPSYPSMPALLE